ncbi:MAG: hypothetical protein Q9187_003060 [Circinaria calcarea]
MLHELLLALSGHPSPLLSNSKENEPLSPLLSSSEEALLRSIANLGNLHIEIRQSASQTSSSHPSIVCRAVSTAIVSTYLGRFQERILSIESGILQEDASFVGAYKTVPLSGVVGAFDGWERILQWLNRITQFIQSNDSCFGHVAEHGSAAAKQHTSGAQLINRLRDEAKTGYPDIEQVALGLVEVAESAWLRQLSAWVLYGRLPTSGMTGDLFIQDQGENGPDAFSCEVHKNKYPSFVTSTTANSILFIGKSINHIRSKLPSVLDAGTSVSDTHQSSLLAIHLNYLSSLKHPISSTKFSQVIGAIRNSLSQNALQKLLPLSDFLRVLCVLRGYFLLERGEFAIALIASADNSLSSKHQQNTVETHQKSAHRLGGILIKESEVAATLTRTWAALAALQSDEDDDADETMDLARELMCLSIRRERNPSAKPSLTSLPGSLSKLREIRTTFYDVLLATPTVLSIAVNSPQDLFLTPDDVEFYSQIHAYLLSIRRAHLHLTNLWKLSVLRRELSAIKDSSTNSQQLRSDSFNRVRKHNSKRTRSMRRVWALIGSAVYFLAELGEYFQGEIVTSSWTEFFTWLDPSTQKAGMKDRTILQSSTIIDSNATGSRPDSSSSARATTSYNQPVNLKPAQDPESLMLAHRRYLTAMVHGLLLDDQLFTQALRGLMQKLDHLGALMGGLSAAQKAVDPRCQNLSYQVEEESKLMRSLYEVCASVETDIHGLVGRLRDINMERLSEDLHAPLSGYTGGFDFVPYKGNGVDRLLLKLDSLGLHDMATT